MSMAITELMYTIIFGLFRIAGKSMFYSEKVKIVGKVVIVDHTNLKEKSHLHLKVIFQRL